MDEGSLGLLLLAGVAVIAAIIFHARGRSFLLASFASAGTAIITVLVVDTVHRGYPDKFLPIAFVVGGLYAFLISLPVGLVMRRVIARRKDKMRRQ